MGSDLAVAVLGSGNGAVAHAGDLALAGHGVRLAHLPARRDSLAEIRSAGAVEVLAESFGRPGTSASGRTGSARLESVGTDVGDAVRGADVVIVCVAVGGQRAFMEAILPCLVDGQVLIFTPGKFAALEFRALLRDQPSPPDVAVAEFASLLYVARRVGGSGVLISAVKTAMAYAELPVAATATSAAPVIAALFPQLERAPNVVETSFCGHGDVMHPAHAILNAARIDERGARAYRHLGVTPSVGRVIEALDDERLAVAAAIGVPCRSVPDALQHYYGSSTDSVYEAVRSTACYTTLEAPDNLRHRYVSEKIPFGLVPMASLGRYAGVPTPLTDSMIRLGSVLGEEDYWASGRTMERLDLTPSDLAALLA